MAEAQRAQATAEQAGPLAAATAKQEVVVQETKADAKRVKLEAEATATQTRQVGEAQAAATTARGTAEGEAVKARGLAEAEAIKARAAALAQNQDAVIAQQIAERLPLIVAEAAKAFSGIGQFTVLNGAEGVGEAFAQVLGMGATAIPLLRNALRQNGTATGQSTPPKAEQTKRTK